MNYEQTFKEIYNDLQHVEESGHVADYITELAQVDPDQFGVHLTVLFCDGLLNYKKQYLGTDKPRTGGYPLQLPAAARA